MVSFRAVIDCEEEELFIGTSWLRFLAERELVGVDGGNVSSGNWVDSDGDDFSTGELIGSIFVGRRKDVSLAPITVADDENLTAWFATDSLSEPS